jgi:TRAP-type C4-dicarboxylate transport system permease small subunit
MRHFHFVMQQLRNLLKVLGAACLVGMTLLTCIDVIGRRMGSPVFGSVELVGFMATLTVAFALPYTHAMKGHIGVELLVRNFSKRVQAAIECCTLTVAFFFFGVVTWRMGVYAGAMRQSGEVSMNLGFPVHLIIYLCAFCFLVFTLTILEDIAASVQELTGKT